MGGGLRVQEETCLLSSLDICNKDDCMQMDENRSVEGKDYELRGNVWLGDPLWHSYCTADFFPEC